MSSNSLELLLKMGMLDFLSPCFVAVALVSGDMNLAMIRGGFISDILGVLCSGAESSCSLPVRSDFPASLMESDDGTSSSDFSRFVRSLFAIFFSIVSFASLQAALSSTFSMQLFVFDSPAPERDSCTGSR